MSTYNLEMLNSFNLEVQFKDTEFVVRNKLTDLLTELKEFEFVTALVLQSEKQKMMMKQRLKQLLMRVILMTDLNPSTVRLYQIYKNLL